jgi:hypothetical protein
LVRYLSPSIGIRRAARLARIEGPVAVLAHSCAGIPVTEATAGATTVSRLVYLAAYQPDEGESMISAHGAPEPPREVEFMPVPRGSPAAPYADVDTGLAERAIARLRPHSMRSCVDKVTAAGWKDIPSSYILCDQDAILPTTMQEGFSRHAGAVHHLPTSHSPFLSKPALLADLLGEIVGSAHVQRSVVQHERSLQF